MATSLLLSMDLLTVLPHQPDGVRCIGYLFGHLLDRSWGIEYDARTEPPAFHREPLIVRTRETLQEEGYLPIFLPTPEKVRAGSIVVYGDLFRTGYRAVSTALSQGERATFLRPAATKAPAFVAEHFGLVVQNDGRGKLLVESKLGSGPACVHELETAPYGRDVVFFVKDQGSRVSRPADEPRPLGG